MKNLTLAFSPYGNGDNIYPFDGLFSFKQDAAVTGLDGADAFLLWGGTDIHPSYYKTGPNKFSGAPMLPSNRDKWEWAAMKYCKANKIPIIGVCRGAQFICAFAGGKLIQHCDGHGNGRHAVLDIADDYYDVTSSHHQMMDVTGTRHELVAWTAPALSSFYYGETNETPKEIEMGLSTGKFREPEVVFFPDINALAIQGHPEWCVEDSKFVKKSLAYIEEYLFSGRVWK